MWSFTSQNKEKTPKSPDDDFAFHDDFTDADLNDAGLLAELAKLTLSSSTKQKVPKNTVQAKTQVKSKKGAGQVHLESLDISHLVEGDVEVELTEDDLNDPKLLVFILNSGGAFFDWMWVA